MEVWDFTVSGGTPALDATGDLVANSGLSSPFMPEYCRCGVLTGTGDVVLQMGAANVGVTAVNSPWSSNANLNATETGEATAAVVGVTSFTKTELYCTVSVSSAERAAMAFGFSPTACTPGSLMDSHSGANAGAPTSATLWSSTFGATGGSPSSAIHTNEVADWVVTNPSSALTYATSSYHALGGSAPRLCNSGATYSDASTVGISYATGTGSSAVNVLTFNFPYIDSGKGVSSTALASAWFQTSLPSNATVNCDCFAIYGSTGGLSNMIISGFGSGISTTIEGLTGGSPVALTANTWYQVGIEYVTGGAAKMNVYDANGLRLNSTPLTTGTQSGYSINMKVGQNLSSACTGACAGNTIWWDKIQMCYLGCSDTQFPYGIAVKVGTPVDSPGAGTYSISASVSLTAQDSSSIVYTTNGTTPACPATGTTYSTPISITTTATVKAIGCSSNASWVSSAVLTSVYTITSAITMGTGVSSGYSTSSPLAFNVTIPSNAGGHVALVVNITGQNGATSCTYNGTSMTSLGAAKADGAAVWKAQQFILINPTADGAAHSLSCTATGTESKRMEYLRAACFGVNQTGTVGNSWRTPPTATNDGGSGTTTSTITATTVTNDVVVDNTSVYNPPSRWGTQTQLFNGNNLGGNALYQGVSNFTATGVSTTMTWTFTSTFWAHVAVALIPG